MLKRILVLLDETPSSIAARHLAIEYARETGAEVTGLAGIDLTFIETGEAVPIGGMAFKVHREKELKRQAEESRGRLHEKFAAECAAASVPFGWLSFEGEPLAMLYQASETRDVVITGYDTAFRGQLREDRPDMLAKLIMASPRPTIVCADKPSQGRDVLVAYDGSLPAMRAVQIFALLGLAAQRRVIVTAIEADQGLAERRTNSAAAYLRSHGYDVGVDPVVSRDTPARIIRTEIANGNIGIVVMGGYGHRGWREFFFGSTTRALIEAPPCALFIYH
jgi:nucleotide-binding universal stress UspA family protein